MMFLLLSVKFPQDVVITETWGHENHNLAMTNSSCGSSRGLAPTVLEDRHDENRNKRSALLKEYQDTD